MDVKEKKDSMEARQKWLGNVFVSRFRSLVLITYLRTESGRYLDKSRSSSTGSMVYVCPWTMHAALMSSKSGD